MPTFSPKFSFWFGVVVSVLIGISGGAIHIVDLVPAEYVKPVTGWVGLFAFVSSTILTAMHGLSSVGPGPLAGPPTVDEAHKVMQQAKAAAQ